MIYRISLNTFQFSEKKILNTSFATANHICHYFC